MRRPQAGWRNFCCPDSTPRPKLLWLRSRHGGWWRRDPSQLCMETTAMIIIGIILSVFAIAFFCWLLFTLAVYALPVFVGLAAAFAAHHAGYGVFASGLIAIFAGGAVLALGQLAFALVRTPILRAAIALIFAVPAAVCGLLRDSWYRAHLHHVHWAEPCSRGAWRGAGRRHGLEPHGASCFARRVRRGGETCGSLAAFNISRALSGRLRSHCRTWLIVRAG